MVKVNKRGQTTLPAEYRERLGIKERDDLLIEETAGGLLVRLIPNILDLAGADARYGTPKETKNMVEKMREEY